MNRGFGMITLRVIAGTMGAYGLTVLASTALSRLLVLAGMDRIEAVMTASLSSFALFTLIALAAFRARDPRRALAWIAGLGLLCTLVTLRLGHR